ncbi:uncharacterized protein LOC135930805 [Gordionus sp. m RMFG-2023]|uniref:uncharacterized protein LOC135930805 n=1 Tax=Gordionus sp. m RMFG-2023 TaxID=3053472 RepID=UPI0031FC72E0
MANFKQFYKESRIRHILTPPYHPSSNGQVERMVAIVKNWIRKAGNQGNGACLAQLYYLNFRNKEGVTPAELFLGRRTRVPLDFLRAESHEKGVRKDRKIRFEVGEKVWTRLFDGRGRKWAKGIVGETEVQS